VEPARRRDALEGRVGIQRPGSVRGRMTRAAGRFPGALTRARLTPTHGADFVAG
jgi:hypothetical protein